METLEIEKTKSVDDLDAISGIDEPCHQELPSLCSMVTKYCGAVEASSVTESSQTGEGKKYLDRTGRGKVLFMDDEEDIREIAIEILDSKGYEVESCADGSEAVEIYRAAWEGKSPFAAVILDMTVPRGMGGKECAGIILEMDPDAVLIVSSGYSNDPVVANFRQFGFSGAIPKPFDADALVGELERVVSGRR